MAYIEDEDVATIKNALTIIRGYSENIIHQPHSDSVTESNFLLRKRLEEIVFQVDRINKLLPEISYHNAETK